MATRTRTAATKTKMGGNRTGIAVAPELSQELISNTRKTKPPPGDIGKLSSMRGSYVTANGALGTLPPPVDMKGVATVLKDKVAGKNPEVFLDKLGERLAFERAGVRLYDLFLVKCQYGPKTNFFSMNDVKHIQSEEAQHFQLLKEVMESMGGDPTAQTPAADVAGVASMGIIQVLSDPRTSIAQGLEALLTAELVDNAGWEMLISLAEGLGLDETADQFRRALEEENEHLAKVKSWHQQAVMAASGGR